MTVNIVTPDNLERFAEGSKEKFARASHTHSNATTSKAGFMSATDKQNLDTLVQNGVSLSPATTNTLGGVKVGANLSVTADGTLSADAQQYTLPTASADTLGGVKVGTNLSISNGVLSATNTNTKVTSVGNHYTPRADTNSALTSSTSSTGTYALNTEYNVVTGITLSRDAKGHVVGISTTNQKVKDTNTTYSSKTAASGGTDVSLVTTGEKYTWNNKSNLAIGTTATTAAAGNHTHTASLATDSGTATVTLAYNTTYKLTAGGSSIIFKTPADNNTTYSSKDAASGGTDVSLVTTGEKYTWNSKADGNHTHSYLPLSGGTLTGTLIVPALSFTSDAAVTYDEFGNIKHNGTTTTNYWHVDTNSGSVILAAVNNGNVGIGTTTPSSKLEVAGAVKGSSFQATSDRRKKSDIKEVGDLDLSSIKSYNYILKDTKRRHTGLIAQEVQDIIPDAVKADEKGYLSLDYNAVVAVLVAKVNKLESRIKELENK